MNKTMTSESKSTAVCNHKAGHVCPWWVALLFDNPMRRRVHSPEKILSAYVREGMRTLDIGCGLGHFPNGMAGMVGEAGTVTAVDV